MTDIPQGASCIKISGFISRPVARTETIYLHVITAFQFM